MYKRGNQLTKPKTQNRISNIRNSFLLKKKVIKDRIIRYIWTLSGTEEEKKGK